MADDPSGTEHEPLDPKSGQAGRSNTEKTPKDWVTGEEAMTGAQASYLKTLCEEAGTPDQFSEDLTKAEASRRIDALRARAAR